MENVNQVSQKMLDLIIGSNRIELDIDGGDKVVNMNCHTEEMLEIGAFAISRTHATTVRIACINDDEKRRVIDFYPQNGNYDLIKDEWKNNTPSIVELEINEPTDEALWEAMHNNDIKAETGRRSWYFKGKRSDLENFITGYYARHDREQQQEFFDEIVDDATKIEE